MSVRHLIFDLDGTLVDSAPLCAGIVNAMLSERGSARRVTAEAARACLTRGGNQTVAALLAGECGEVEAELADFRARYMAMPTPAESLYPGVRDGLERLAAQGARLAICSNKPQALCDKIVADLDLGEIIAAVVGSRPGLALKPAPDLVAVTLDGLGAPPGDCLFVGDSEVDQRTAEAAGIPFLFVAYGYAEPGWRRDGLTAFADFDALAAHLGAPGLARVA